MKQTTQNHWHCTKAELLAEANGRKIVNAGPDMCFDAKIKTYGIVQGKIFAGCYRILKG